MMTGQSNHAINVMDARSARLAYLAWMISLNQDAKSVMSASLAWDVLPVLPVPAINSNDVKSAQTASHVPRTLSSKVVSNALIATSAENQTHASPNNGI